MEQVIIKSGINPNELSGFVQAIASKTLKRFQGTPSAARSGILSRHKGSTCGCLTVTAPNKRLQIGVIKKIEHLTRSKCKKDVAAEPLGGSLIFNPMSLKAENRE